MALLGFIQPDFSEAEWIQLRRCAVELTLVPSGATNLSETLESADCLIVRNAGALNRSVAEAAGSARFVAIVEGTVPDSTIAILRGRGAAVYQGRGTKFSSIEPARERLAAVRGDLIADLQRFLGD